MLYIKDTKIVVTVMAIIAITFFFCQNTGYISKGSSAIVIDSSNSEGVVCVRNESASYEGPIHHHTRDQSPSHFFEFHCIVIVIGPLHSMHLIFVQDTLTLLEVIEIVFMLRGEAEGAAAEQTINMIISNVYGHTSCLCSELYSWCQSSVESTW